MATSGVGLLSQVLGSTLEANRRNAMWRAEQEQQNEMAQAQREAAQQHLAAQLRANLFGQLLADQTKNVAMAQSEERWAQRERERDAAAARALDKQIAREDARVKAAELKADAQRDSADIAGKSRVEAAKVPRVSRHYGYSITERRGDVGRAVGGGGQEDFRKTQEAFEADKITRVYLAQIGAAASMPAQQRVMAEAEAKKQFADRMEELRSRRSTGPVAPAAPTVVGVPEMLRRPPEQMGAAFDPTDPFR